MVALWIRAGTVLAGQTALGVRLLGPLAAALASWMLFDAARVLFPGTSAGLVAVMLLNASLLLGVGTVIMTPDSPLLFFWTAAFWAMARLRERRRRRVVAGGGSVRRSGARQQIHRDCSCGSASGLWVAAGSRRSALAAAMATLGGVRDRAVVVRAGADLECGARLGWIRPARRSRRGLAAGPCGRVSGGIGRRTDRSCDTSWCGRCAWPVWRSRSGGPGGRAIRRGRCWRRCRCRRCWCSCSTRSVTGCRATGRRSSTRR